MRPQKPDSGAAARDIPGKYEQPASAVYGEPLYHIREQPGLPDGGPGGLHIDRPKPPSDNTSPDNNRRWWLGIDHAQRATELGNNGETISKSKGIPDHVRVEPIKRAENQRRNDPNVSPADAEKMPGETLSESVAKAAAAKGRAPPTRQEQSTQKQKPRAEATCNGKYDLKWCTSRTAADHAPEDHQSCLTSTSPCNVASSSGKDTAASCTWTTGADCATSQPSHQGRGVDTCRAKGEAGAACDPSRVVATNRAGKAVVDGSCNGEGANSSCDVSLANGAGKGKDVKLGCEGRDCHANSSSVDGVVTKADADCNGGPFDGCARGIIVGSQSLGNKCGPNVGEGCAGKVTLDSGKISSNCPARSCGQTGANGRQTTSVERGSQMEVDRGAVTTRCQADCPGWASDGNQKVTFGASHADPVPPGSPDLIPTGAPRGPPTSINASDGLVNVQCKNCDKFDPETGTGAARKTAHMTSGDNARVDADGIRLTCSTTVAGCAGSGTGPRGTAGFTGSGGEEIRVNDTETVARCTGGAAGSARARSCNPDARQGKRSVGLIGGGEAKATEAGADAECRDPSCGAGTVGNGARSGTATGSGGVHLWAGGQRAEIGGSCPGCDVTLTDPGGQGRGAHFEGGGIARLDDVQARTWCNQGVVNCRQSSSEGSRRAEVDCRGGEAGHAVKCGTPGVYSGTVVDANRTLASCDGRPVQGTVDCSNRVTDGAGTDASGRCVAEMLCNGQSEIVGQRVTVAQKCTHAITTCTADARNTTGSAATGVCVSTERCVQSGTAGPGSANLDQTCQGSATCSRKVAAAGITAEGGCGDKQLCSGVSRVDPDGGVLSYQECRGDNDSRCGYVLDNDKGQQLSRTMCAPLQPCNYGGAGGGGVISPNGQAGEFTTPAQLLQQPKPVQLKEGGDPGPGELIDEVTREVGTDQQVAAVEPGYLPAGDDTRPSPAWRAAAAESTERAQRIQAAADAGLANLQQGDIAVQAFMLQEQATRGDPRAHDKLLAENRELLSRYASELRRVQPQVAPLQRVHDTFAGELAAANTALTASLEHGSAAAQQWLKDYQAKEQQAAEKGELSPGPSMIANALRSGAAAPYWDEDHPAFAAYLNSTEDPKRGEDRKYVANLRAGVDTPRQWAAEFGDRHPGYATTQEELIASTVNVRTWDQLKNRLPDDAEPDTVLEQLRQFNLRPGEQAKAAEELGSQVEFNAGLRAVLPGSLGIVRFAGGVGRGTADVSAGFAESVSDALAGTPWEHPEPTRPVMPVEWSRNPAQASADTARLLGEGVPHTVAAVARETWYRAQDVAGYKVAERWSLQQQPDGTVETVNEMLLRNFPASGGMVRNVYETATNTGLYRDRPGEAMARDVGTLLILLPGPKVLRGAEVARGATRSGSAVRMAVDGPVGRYVIDKVTLPVRMAAGLASPALRLASAPAGAALRGAAKGSAALARAAERRGSAAGEGRGTAAAEGGRPAAVASWARAAAGLDRTARIGRTGGELAGSYASGGLRGLSRAAGEVGARRTLGVRRDTPLDEVQAAYRQRLSEARGEVPESFTMANPVRVAKIEKAYRDIRRVRKQEGVPTKSGAVDAPGVLRNETAAVTDSGGALVGAGRNTAAGPAVAEVPSAAADGRTGSSVSPAPTTPAAAPAGGQPVAPPAGSQPAGGVLAEVGPVASGNIGVPAALPATGVVAPQKGTAAPLDGLPTATPTDAGGARTAGAAAPGRGGSTSSGALASGKDAADRPGRAPVAPRPHEPEPALPPTGIGSTRGGPTDPKKPGGGTPPGDAVPGLGTRQHSTEPTMRPSAQSRQQIWESETSGLDPPRFPTSKQDKSARTQQMSRGEQWKSPTKSLDEQRRAIQDALEPDRAQSVARARAELPGLIDQLYQDTGQQLREVGARVRPLRRPARLTLSGGPAREQLWQASRERQELAEYASFAREAEARLAVHDGSPAAGPRSSPTVPGRLARVTQRARQLVLGITVAATVAGKLLYPGHEAAVGLPASKIAEPAPALPSEARTLPLDDSPGPLRTSPASDVSPVAAHAWTTPGAAVSKTDPYDIRLLWQHGSIVRTGFDGRASRDRQQLRQLKAAVIPSGFSHLRWAITPAAQQREAWVARAERRYSTWPRVAASVDGARAAAARCDNREAAAELREVIVDARAAATEARAAADAAVERLTDVVGRAVGLLQRIEASQRNAPTQRRGQPRVGAALGSGERSQLVALLAKLDQLVSDRQGAGRQHRRIDQIRQLIGRSAGSVPAAVAAMEQLADDARIVATDERRVADEVQASVTELVTATHQTITGLARGSAVARTRFAALQALAARVEDARASEQPPPPDRRAELGPERLADGVFGIGLVITGGAAVLANWGSRPALVLAGGVVAVIGAYYLVKALRRARAPPRRARGFQKRIGSTAVPVQAAEPGGAEVTVATRRRWAELLDEPVSLPGGFDAAADLMRLWVAASAELMGTGTLADATLRKLGYRRQRQRAPPPVVVHQIERGVTSRAKHWFDADGVLHVSARDAAGVVHELVEALFAPWAGFGDQAHTVAVLAERAVPGQTVAADSWVSRRVLTELEQLAVGDRPGLRRLLGELRRVRREIGRRFAGMPDWERLNQRHARQVNTAADQLYTAGPKDQPAVRDAREPAGEIVRDGGVRVFIHSNDHAPLHAHVSGGGPETKIGEAGHEINRGPVPTPRQRAVIDEHRLLIRRALRNYRRWHRAQRPDTGAGPLAVGGLRAWQTRLLAWVLRRLTHRMRPVQREYDAMPRAPPGLVVSVALSAVPRWVRVLISGLGRRLVAFGLPGTGPGSVIVVFEHTRAEINGHLSAGRLDPTWWDTVLAHEREFHLDGHQRGDDEHDRDAQALAAELTRARQDSAAAAAPAAPRAVGFALVGAGLISLVFGVLPVVGALTASPAPTVTQSPPAVALGIALGAPAEQPPLSYTTAGGDTLAKLALRFGVPVEQLAADNGITNVNRIGVGQLLVVRPAAPGTLVIAPGSTFNGAAARLGVVPDELAAANPQIANRNRIYAGSQLHDPTYRAPPPPPPPSPAPATPAAPQAGGGSEPAEAAGRVDTASTPWPWLAGGAAVAVVTVLRWLRGQRRVYYAAGMPAARRRVRRWQHAAPTLAAARQARLAALTDRQRQLMRWLDDQVPRGGRERLHRELGELLGIPAALVVRPMRGRVAARAPPGVQRLSRAKILGEIGLVGDDAQPVVDALVAAQRAWDARPDSHLLITVALNQLAMGASRLLLWWAAGRLNRVALGVRGVLVPWAVSNFDASGAQAAAFPALMAGLFAATYGVAGGGHEVQGWTELFTLGVTAVMFLVNAMFASRLPLGYAVLSALTTAAAFLAMGFAPVGALPLLVAVLGWHDASAGVTRDRFGHFPLDPAAAHRREGIERAGFSVSKIVIFTSLVAVTVALGLRPALLVAAGLYAAIALGTLLVLRGGIRPDSLPALAANRLTTVREGWQDLRRDTARLRSRLRPFPASLGSVLASPTVLSSVTAVPYGVFAFAIGNLIAGQLPELARVVETDPAGLLWATAGVTAIIGIAGYLVSNSWPAISRRLGRGSGPRLLNATALSQLAVAPPLLWFLWNPSIISLTATLVTAELAALVTFLPLFPLATGAQSRLIGARVAGIIAGAKLTGFALTSLIGATSNYWPYLVLYGGLATASIPLAHLIGSRIQGDIAEQLRTQLEQTTDGQSAKQIVTLLLAGGIRYLGALHTLPPGYLTDLGLSHTQQQLITDALVAIDNQLGVDPLQRLTQELHHARRQLRVHAGHPQLVAAYQHADQLLADQKKLTDGHHQLDTPLHNRAKAAYNKLLAQRHPNPPTRGGPLAIGELTGEQAVVMDALTPALWAAGRPLSHTELGRARGPPGRYQRVRVLTHAQLVEPDVAARLIAYGLPDGHGDGLIILVAERVPPELLDDVLDYEETHRLRQGGTSTEAQRRRDAAGLIVRLGRPRRW